MNDFLFFFIRLLWLRTEYRLFSSIVYRGLAGELQGFYIIYPFKAFVDIFSKLFLIKYTWGLYFLIRF
jgi:hypothetical protein